MRVRGFGDVDVRLLLFLLVFYLLNLHKCEVVSRSSVT